MDGNNENMWECETGKMVQTFKGKSNEDPNEHIESLERLFAYKTFNEEGKIAIAVSHIREGALDWWKSIQQKPKTFRQYREMIKESYWGKARQMRALREIENEEWESGETMEGFFRRRMAQLRQINVGAPSEEWLIRIAGRGLPAWAKRFLIGVNDMDKVVRRLEEIKDENEEDGESQIANIGKIIKEGGERRNGFQCPKIEVEIGGRKTRALLDSGSQVSVLSQETFSRLTQEEPNLKTLPLKIMRITLANGKRAQAEAVQAWVDIKIAGNQYNQIMLVMQGLIHDVILGSDFMGKYKCSIDYETGQARISGRRMPFTEQDQIKNAERAVHSMELAKRMVTEEIGTKREEEMELGNLLEKYKDIFSDIPGVINGYEHRIKLIQDQPYQSRSYPIPFQYRPEIGKQINNMLEWGIISKCSSPYNNPIVVAKKKDGSVRLCLDARLLNKITVADTNAPPPMSELINRFNGKGVFSTLDMTSSYWQISLHPDDRQYTAFRYNGIAYQFNRIPFGLKNSGAGLIQCLDRVLSEEVKGFSTTYVDDIIIASEDNREHIKCLRKLFQDCREKGIKINLGKSRLMTPEVKFLGHIISKEGVSPNPEKVQAIQEFPEPKKKRDIKAFLGLCNFFKQYYPNFSERIEPLLRLLRKETPWAWREEQEASFRQIKEGFLRHVVLAHPDFGRTFYVQTDSSGIGMGAMMFQKEDNGQSKAIAFISRLFTKAEQNYTVTEREALAIVWAFKKLRQYLVGSKVVVVTDHRSLEFLNRSFLTNSRLIRWSLTLQEFDYTVEYCKGRDNIIADTLSRYPLGRGLDRNEEPYIAATRAQSREPYSLQKIREAQREDRECRQIMDFGRNRAVRNSQGNTLWAHREKCVIKNGLLQRQTGSGRNYRVIIPRALRKSIVTLAHDERGHFGGSKTSGWIEQWFYWPNLHRDVMREIKKCLTCAKTKPMNRSNEGTSTPILVYEPNDTIAIDFYGPLPMSKGRRYLLVAYDLYSKLVSAFPISQANARQAIRALEDRQFKEVGKPRRILSDNGTPFVSKEWAQWVKRNNIKHALTSIRNPQANPCERMMRELGRLFRIYVHGNHKAWVKETPRVVSMINETRNESTGFEPYRLHFGRMRPYPYAQGPWPQRERINRARDAQEAKQQLQKMSQVRKKRQGAVIGIFREGDRVMVRTNPVSRPEQGIYKKFQPLYEGPYVIGHVYGNNAFILYEGTRRIGTYNARALKLVNEVQTPHRTGEERGKKEK